MEEGLREIGTACPDLKHLKLVECQIVQRIYPPARQLELESLSLASSEWSGWGHPPFAGPQLRQLDISHTNIGDPGFRGVVGHAAPRHTQPLSAVPTSSTVLCIEEPAEICVQSAKCGSDCHA